MKKSQAISIIGVLSALTLLGFNNCGNTEMQFSEVDPAMRILASADTSSSDQEEVDLNVEEQMLSDAITEVIHSLPQEEIDNPIPVTEIENDPSLLERYKCDSSSVLICHFPKNIESFHDACIGVSALDSHYGHIREYFKNNELRSISDYLGPCRIDL